MIGSNSLCIFLLDSFKYDSCVKDMITLHFEDMLVSNPLKLYDLYVIIKI